MPVNYKLIQRTNLQDKKKPGKYYAIPISMKKITMYDIGKEIGQRTTIKMPVLVGVLEALYEITHQKNKCTIQAWKRHQK